MAKRICLIDDNPEMVNLLGDALAAAGYAVEKITTGDLALTALAARLPDMVITDLVMPSPDGLEIIRFLRTCCASVKIIAFSGVVRDGLYLLGARQLGANLVLSLPFTAHVLVDHVDRLFALETKSGDVNPA